MSATARAAERWRRGAGRARGPRARPHGSPVAV